MWLVMAILSRVLEGIAGQVADVPARHERPGGTDGRRSNGSVRS
jgi:hypothetical protein